MSASQPAYFHLQEFSDLGILLVGGRLYTYAQGTTTFKTAYTDPAGAVPQTYTADGMGGQYIALDARGELPAPLYLTIGAYDIALKRADGSTVWTRRAEPTVDGAPSGASMVGADDAAGGTIFTTVAAYISRVRSSAGASLIGFLQDGIAARAKTAQEKMREQLSLTDYSTIVADGTDQTAKIIAWLATLGVNYTGVIRIPYNTRFDNAAVVAALPSRAAIVDESLVNSWNTGGYFARVMGITDNSADAATDLTFRISSSHNANMVLDNRGTAASTSATNGIAAVIWGRGSFARGQPGIRGMGRHEFGQIAGTGKWSWGIRRYLPWAAQAAEYWSASTVIPPGSYIISTPELIYMTVSGGTTGASPPTHTSGTAVDGTVTWTFVSGQTDGLCFAVNENGELAANTAPTSGVVAYLKASPDSGGTGILIVEAANASQRAELRLIPTDAASVAITAIPRLRAENDGSLRFRTTALSDLIKMTETHGAQFGMHSPIEKQATLNSATPSVLSCGMLYFANTLATNVTFFTDNLPAQIVQCFFENGNTTLVHNAASFVLKGGTNVTPAAGQVIFMQKYSRSAAFFEVGRNF